MRKRLWRCSRRRSSMHGFAPILEQALEDWTSSPGYFRPCAAPAQPRQPRGAKPLTAGQRHVNEALELWDAAVAQHEGDKARRFSSRGKMEKRRRGVLPNTRATSHALRHSFLTNLPTRSVQKTHGCTDTAAVQTLVWHACSDAMRAGVRQWYSDAIKKPDEHPYLVLSRANDATSFHIQLSDEEIAVWMRWELDLLRMKQFFEATMTEEEAEKDVQQLAALLHGRKSGFVHLLGQKVHLLRSGESQAVVTRATAMQRTTATNNFAAMEAQPFHELSIEYLTNKVLPYIGFMLYHLAADRGPGPQRMARDIEAMLRPHKNCAFLNLPCVGHIVGGAIGDSIKAYGMLTFYQRWGKLLKHAEYTNAWHAGMTYAAGAIARSGISRADQLADVEEAISESDAIWERLFEQCICRDLAVSSAAHPLEPAAGPPEDILKRRAKKRETFNELKLLLQLRRAGIRHACHICVRGRCGPRYCTESSWLKRFMKAWSLTMADLMPVGSDVAGNKYTSWCRILPLLSCMVLVGDLGPSGWLAKYPVDEVDRRLRMAERARAGMQSPEADYQHDAAVRLHAASTWLDSPMNRALGTIANVKVLPADTLLRFLDRSNAAANDKKGYEPTIFHLATRERSRNAFCIYERAVADMLWEGSDVGFLLMLWWHDSGSDSAFYSQLAFRSLRLILQEYCRMYLLLGSRMESGPYLVFNCCAAQCWHGLVSNESMDAALLLWQLPHCCCDDAFTLRILPSKAVSLVVFLRSIRLQAAREGAKDMAIINFDVERFLGMLRAMNRQDQARALDLVSTALGLREIRRQHERRGCVTACGTLKSKEMSAAGLRILQRRAPKRWTREVSPWQVYYHEVIVPGWREANKASQRTNEAPFKKGYRHASDSTAGKPVYIKGLAGWMTWEMYFKRMTHRYNNSQILKASYRTKATIQNMEKPRRQVQLFPAAVVPESMTFWSMGDMRSPLRESKLNAFLAKAADQMQHKRAPISHPGSHAAPGPVTVGKLLKKQGAGMLMVTDPAKGRSPAPERRLLCCEQFPGACRWKDRAVFAHVMRITQNFNTWFYQAGPQDELEGRLLRMTIRSRGPDFDGDSIVDFLVCHVRKSQPQVQIFVPVDDDFMEGETEKLKIRVTRDQGICALTSYRFVADALDEVRRQLCQLLSVKIEERFFAPAPGEDLLYLHPVERAQDVG